MNHISGKRETALLDGTPEKRMFWSIISDYNVQTALCELVDNAIDQWIASGRKDKLSIELLLDADRQLISIKDSAGGVSKADLKMLITPGGSKNSPDANTIGIFGVGSKRAVIALAEQVVIKTHFKGDKTYEVDVSKDWLESPEWEIPAYEISDISESTTLIELSALRKTFSHSDVDHLKQHLGETYLYFIQAGKCEITVNGDPINAVHFDNWAYPPEQEPRRHIYDVPVSAKDRVRVEIIAGLINDRDPAADNYGVYFYCNDRLIVKELKVRDVGYFVTSEAGVPHPDASLCRTIVRINGKAKWMPWTSSKTGINYDHPVFQSMRPSMIQLVSYFSSLSRRLKNEWDEKVFEYTKGKIRDVDAKPAGSGKKLILPPLPRVIKHHVETLKSRNELMIHHQPWTLGLVEAVAAVTIVTRQKLETKNRIALILLDSNFEIALKEFVVHHTDLFPVHIYTDTRIKALFSKRHDVIAEVVQKIHIPQTLIDKAKHYYGLRNKLIHERATVGITDFDVDNYDATIREILKILFQLNL
jgi:hypothetical protein